MTGWAWVQVVQGLVTLACAAIAWHLLRLAQGDLRWLAGLRPAQREVAHERYRSARSLFAVTVFLLSANLINLGSLGTRPFTWTPFSLWWFANGTGIRLLILVWLIERLRSWYRLRAIVRGQR
ncbi:MAG: hypothetical protein R2708_27800 [Vicinamibacterales bacterium]